MDTKIFLAVGAALLLAIAGYFYLGESEPEPNAEITTALSAPIEEPDLEPAVTPKPKISPAEKSVAVDTIVMPPAGIDGSDVQIMLAVADLSVGLAQWLVPEEQLRKWVLFIDNTANGDLITKYQPWNYSMKPLSVATLGDKKYLAPSNYQRAKPLLDLVFAIEPKKLADYYYSWLPLLNAAYRELGKKDSFDVRFKQAIDKVLAAKSLTKEPQLILPSVMYQYHEKSLEQADDIDKLLWRLGFENTNNIQQYLSDFKRYL